VTLQLTQKEQHMKRKRGVLSEKEKLSKIIQKLAQKSSSLEMLSEKIIQNNVKPYYRNYKLTGIYLNKRKLRLTTLGIDKAKLKELTLEQKRLDLLKKQRYNQEQEKNLER
tara:strand:+ start:106304 stop:106636 length:333 start_codon:yes stop_codon:yes gene_type:complete